MRGSKILLTATAMAAFSLTGFAQTATPAPDQTTDPNFQQGSAPPPKNLPPGVKADSVRGRNKVEADRITRGVQNGQLTPEEAAHLKNQERHIVHQEKEMKANSANGKLTKAEKEKLTAEQNRESRNIRRARHNDQKP